MINPDSKAKSSLKEKMIEQGREDAIQAKALLPISISEIKTNSPLTTVNLLNKAIRWGRARGWTRKEIIGISDMLLESYIDGWNAIIKGDSR